MKTMPGSPAQALSRNSAAATHGRRRNSRKGPLPDGRGSVAKCPWLQYVAGFLAVNRSNLIRGYVAVGAQGIDVGVDAPGGRIADFLGPVDTQGGVHGGHHVLRARLLFVIPAGLEALLAPRVGAAQDAAALDAGAGEQAGIALVVVVAAGHVVERSRRAAELPQGHHQGLV